MSPLLLVLAACDSGVSGKDSTPTDTPETGDTDSGPTVTEDSDSGSPTVPCDDASALPYDLCDDGLDNDCDGVVDGAFCAKGGLAGAGVHDLGYTLAVAPNDFSLWAFTADPDDGTEGRHVGQVFSDGGPDLQPVWDCCESGVYRNPRLALARHGEERYLAVQAYFDFAGVALFTVPGMDRVGEAPELYGTLFVTDRTAIGVDLWSEGDSLTAFVGTGLGGAYLLVDPPLGDTFLDESADLILKSDSPEAEDEGFGGATLLLPDPGGDGVSDYVASSIGSQYIHEVSSIYFFDGTLRGAFGPEDASAVLATDSHGYGVFLDRAGDVNGDGYGDIVQSTNRSSVLMLGPFDASGDLIAWYTTVGGHAVTAEFSVNGDDAVDLAVSVQGEDAVYLYSGPFQPGTYAGEDATHRVPTQTEVNEMVFADVDADGAAELVIANGYWRDPNGEGSAGVIAALDLSAW